MQASAPPQVIWSNKAIDYGDYHATYRCGSHAIMFSNFYGRGKDVGIYDLDAIRIIKTYKLKENESLVHFGFPYLVSATNEKIIRIWDANLDSREPIHEVDVNLSGIQRGVVYDGKVILFSTQLENVTPKYMSVIECASGNCYSRSKIEGIDPETAVLIHQKSLIISQFFGGVVTIIPLEEGKETRTINTVGDFAAYSQKLTQENFPDYLRNIFKHLVADGNTLVGATSKVIKVWDFQNGNLKKEFSTEEPCQLYSVQERFLFGTTVTSDPIRKDVVKVWDIESGNTLFEVSNISTHSMPHCLLYNHTMYHVHAYVSQMPDTFVDLPSTIPLDNNGPVAASKTSQVCVVS